MTFFVRARRFARVVAPNPAPAPIPFSSKVTIGTAQNSWKWDTQSFVLLGTAPNQYVVGDQYARFAIDVPNGCGYLDVEAISTASVSGNGELGNTVDVSIDGTIQLPTLRYTTPGVKQTIRLTVPGTGTRRVELFEQLCYVTGLTPQTTASIIPAATPAKSAVFVGASGTMGYWPLSPGSGIYTFLTSWAGRVKASHRFDASYLLGTSGYGITAYGVTDATTAAAFVASTIVPRCTGTTEIVIWYEMAAGDMIVNATSPTQWATRMGYLLDATHAALPAAKIYIQSPIVWGAEATPNAGGYLMQDFRNVFAALQSARPSYVTIAVGYAGGATPAMSTSVGQLQDGAHFTGAAHRDNAYPYVASVL